jgi:formylglycine-generating enzyme required for sulfatase activity
MTITLAPGIVGSQPATDQRGATDDLGIRWIEVEAGSLKMGGDGAARTISIERFLISATEVTFDQYDAFCDATGTQKPDDNGWGRGARPVINVSYEDAAEFCEWLSGETRSGVRLPSEAEWVYAAQGGHRSQGYTYSGGNDKDEVSWNQDNSGDRTHPVGTKQPNELGLYDMSGNLWEWCADVPQAETRVSGKDAEHVVCGDSFDNPGSSMGYKLSVRLPGDSRHINIGFRIARSDQRH